MCIKIKRRIPSIALILILIITWSIISTLDIIPKFMLPSPMSVLRALINNFPILIKHSLITISETIIGLIISIILGFIIAILMDRYKIIKQAIYPILVVTQTVPTIAIAPIIILFFGYGILPKIILVILCCFFPITISLTEGFLNINKDYLNLLRSMNASYIQTLIHLKIPFTIPYFFSGLKVSVTYAFISAVVAEWLGGTLGIGVYMTRVKSAYAFDKLFASILFISIISFIFLKLIDLLQNKTLIHLHINKRG